MGGLFAGTPLERPVTCERCAKPLDDCACPRNARGDVTPPSAQDARVRREKRRGKPVTVVTGLDPNATDLKAMLKTLKSQRGVGGTATPDGFELQGDHRDSIVQHLKSLGYPAKPSGG